MFKPIAAVALFLATAASASAASGDAWAEFAANVETKCLAATAELVTDATAVVDPFGSETYGMAIVTGTTVADTPASVICVFDKQTEAVEIGGELPVAVTLNETPSAQ